MIFDHIIVRNGKYYAAGEEVPDEGFDLPFQDDVVSEELPFTDVPEPEPTQETPKRGRPKKTE